MKMTQEELKKILDDYKKWLKIEFPLNELDGKYANLTGEDLTDEDLTDAELAYVDLRNANLRNANLVNANLEYANLEYANLINANLRNANLRNANLTGANLENANLRGADLSGTDLRGIHYNETAPFFALQCPEEGAFIGWKKADSCIIKLQITENAKRSSATTRKCRCSEALVLEIQYIDGSKADITEIESDYDVNFIYKVGEIVKVNDFDEDRWNECSTGIHFFITRQEAINY